MNEILKSSLQFFPSGRLFSVAAEIFWNKIGGGLSGLRASLISDIARISRRFLFEILKFVESKTLEIQCFEKSYSCVCNHDFHLIKTLAIYFS